MELKKSSWLFHFEFFLGFFLAALLIGCAGFTYRYYGMSQVEYNKGMLLGPKASEDLLFSRCTPSGESANPCIVMFAKDFFAWKQDYQDLQNKLIECEKKI